MTTHTIRVELHGAQAHHYKSLVEKLARSGVTDVIKADDGTLWKLPPAEYVYTGDETAAQVRDAVKAIANTVITGNAVFVTKGSATAWTGLQQVYQHA